MKSSYRFWLGLVGLVLAGWPGSVGAEMLVYTGTMKAVEYNYAPTDPFGEKWGPFQDKIYVLIDYDRATDTITEAFAYTYWKNPDSSSWEALPYRLHNLKPVFAVVKGKASTCVFSLDIHNDASVPAAWSLEGKVSTLDLGTGPLDVAAALKGVVIDNTPYFATGSISTGQLQLRLDQNLSREANLSDWDFLTLRNVVKDRLMNLGVNIWWDPETNPPT
ncbi:hypothetical protein [Trichloromonas sp.]|uniref:hypothetical protein n=1 Tax=Trichloromonas sp. TaxID=3069249 RepID=UPI003D816E57